MKFKLVKESLNEDNIDKVRERRFGIIDNSFDNDENYSSVNDSSNKDIVVYREMIRKDEFKIIKNPSSLNDIQYETRAICTKDGTLYIQNIRAATHWRMIDMLKEVGELEIDNFEVEHWHQMLPQNILTLHRDGNTNVFKIGESNEMLSRMMYKIEYENGKINLDTIEAYEKFLELVRDRNPKLKFVVELINQ